MTNEDLKKMDFTESLGILKEGSTALEKLGMNHFIIGEITSADGTYSKYTSASWVRFDPSDMGKETTSQTNNDLITNHLGGIVAVIFDTFGDVFELNHDRKPDFSELLSYMIHFHQQYIQNVQP